MKTTLFLLFTLILTSCLKYQEPKLLSLSGEYIIENIIVHDENFTTEIMNLKTGDIFTNTLEIPKIDTINLGTTKWSFDYSTFYVLPIENVNGTTTYSEQYFYNTFGQNYFDDLGYIDIFIGNKILTFKIINDGTESLDLRSKSELYLNGEITKVNITYKLTRIGP